MKEEMVKCVIWDLDNTLWEGILLENGGKKLRDGVVNILEQLDSRGILLSVCSKNDYDYAMSNLKKLGVVYFFVFPQIGWDNKSEVVSRIISELNISADTVVFIDDEPYELDEVNHFLPEVECINTRDMLGILDNPRFSPKVITQDSKNRRMMYQADSNRKQKETKFPGSNLQFLETLKMKLGMKRATVTDLDRMIELTQRTNQLNTTGVTYGYEELLKLLSSPDHMVLVIELDDIYGSSGKVGIVVIHCSVRSWVIELFIMSCRVMTRGVGSAVMNCILSNAKKCGVELYAEFKHTNKNKMMYMAYIMAGFTKKSEKEEVVMLQNDYSKIQENPSYMEIQNEMIKSN